MATPTEYFDAIFKGEEIPELDTNLKTEEEKRADAENEVACLRLLITSEALIDGASGKKVNAYEIDDGDVYRIDSINTLRPNNSTIISYSFLDISTNDYEKEETTTKIKIWFSKNKEKEEPKIDKAQVVYKEEKKELEVIIIGDKNELYSRVRGILETDILADKTVLFAGLGSGGSPIALELAKSGIGKFILVDMERLELANVSRHACDTRDLGRLKTRAVADAIRARNPYATILEFPINVIKDKAKLERITQEHAPIDLIIAGTDTSESRFLLNQFALEHNIVAIFGRTVVRAAGGDVQRVRRGGSSCVNCLFGGTLKAGEATVVRDGIEVVRPIIVGLQSEADHREREVAYTSQSRSDGAVKTPGLATDINPICIMMTKIALFELSRQAPGLPPKPESGLHSLTMDFNSNCDYWYWANRRDADYKNLPPIGIDASDFLLSQREQSSIQIYKSKGIPDQSIRLSIMNSWLQTIEHSTNLISSHDKSTPPRISDFTIESTIIHRLGSFAIILQLAGLLEEEQVLHVPTTITHIMDARLTTHIKLIARHNINNNNNASFILHSSETERSILQAIESIYTNNQAIWKFPYAQTICRWYGVAGLDYRCSICKRYSSSSS